MPLPEQSPPRRRDGAAEYSFRRSLSVRELVPALGIGVAAGLVAYYLAKIVLQRTPLVVERGGSVRSRASAAERLGRA